MYTNEVGVASREPSCVILSFSPMMDTWKTELLGDWRSMSDVLRNMLWHVGIERRVCLESEICVYNKVLIGVSCWFVLE